MKPVVILGSGHAGYATAREFRKHDAQTPLVLITADDGTSYTKPMLSNAMARGKTADQLAQASAEQMGEQLDARILTHTHVESIDADERRVRCSDGTAIEAAAIVLGVGAEQIEPALGGDAAGAVMAVNDLTAYARARAALDAAERVVIIGGGLIGCEFANDWVKGGYAVTVIEALEHPLGRMLPPQAGAALRAGLERAGVEVITERKVDAVERTDAGFSVIDSSGERHGADVVFRALGLQPRTRLASAAGLDTGRGIRTDRRLETSKAGIYALGDCAEVDGVVLPFIMPINNAARALGATLAGTPTEVHYPVMPVIAKTPACPIQLYTPPPEVAGTWREEVLDSGGVRGLFHDPQGRLRGFVLTGPAVTQKAELAAQVPAYFDNRD